MSKYRQINCRTNLLNDMCKYLLTFAMNIVCRCTCGHMLIFTFIEVAVDKSIKIVVLHEMG